MKFWFRFYLFPLPSNGILTATPSFRPTVLSYYLTGEGWTETPLVIVRSEARVDLYLLLSLTGEIFNCCLSDSDSFGGLPGSAQFPFPLNNF